MVWPVLGELLNMVARKMDLRVCRTISSFLPWSDVVGFQRCRVKAKAKGTNERWGID